MPTITVLLFPSLLKHCCYGFSPDLCFKIHASEYCSKALLLAISQHILFVAGSISHGVDVLFFHCLVLIVYETCWLRWSNSGHCKCAEASRHVCSAHIHSGLRLAPGAEWKDEYTQLEQRILSSSFLSYHRPQYSIVQSTSTIESFIVQIILFI